MRVGAVGGATLALVASSQVGDRAGGDGTCPAGETCSPLTPQGLLFEGSPPGYWPDLTSQAVAAGGYETLHVTDKSTDAPLSLPFVPKMSDAAFSSVANGASGVVLSAGAAGSSYLRVLSPEGELYDRLMVHSYEVDGAIAHPTYAETYPQLIPTSWAAFAGAPVDIAIELKAGGTTVVDEGMAIRGPNAVRVGWDTVRFTPAGDITLAVDAGHATNLAASVPAVTSIERIDAGGDRAVGIGGDETVCFSAYTGGRLVVGVPWQISFTGPATPAADQKYASCVIVNPNAAGQVVVTAQAGGLTAQTVLTVQGGSARRMPAWPLLGTDGERAETAE